MLFSLLAAIALVLIGTAEALVSARQIAELTGPLRLTPSGTGLTAIGFAASALVYLILGWQAESDGQAVRLGAVVGAVSGIVGGAVRSLVIRDALADAVARYATVPDWFVWVVLAIFAIGSAVVSALGGPAIAFLGVRLSRASRSRPPA